MDIKFEIEPMFKIESFKIKSVNFKNKRDHIEKILNQYPEMSYDIFIVIEIKQILFGNYKKYLKMNLN